MTADTQVHEDAPELSTNPMAPLQIEENQCGLHSTSNQDLHKFPAPDNNGRHVGADDPENVIVHGDLDDNSYVFVSGNDDPLHIHNDCEDSAQVINGSKAVQIQNRDFLKSSASAEDNIWVLEGTEIAFSTNADLHQHSADESQGDAFSVAATGHVAPLNGKIRVSDSDLQQLGGHQIESKPSSAATENQESQVAVLVSVADSGGCSEQEMASEVSSESNDVNQISREDNIESTNESGLDQECWHAHLETTVTVTKSPEVDISQSKPEPQQISQLSIQFQGTQDSQTVHLHSAECASRQNEVHTVNSEEKSNVESASPMEAGKSGSESCEFNHGGVQLREETKSQHVYDANGDQGTVYVLSENGQSDDNQGLDIRESVNEVNLLSGTETACGLVLNENKDQFPDSSVNETKESSQHVDDCRNPLELQHSSMGADSLVPVSSCVKTETNKGEESVESVEYVPDVTREHEGEHEAPPCMEEVLPNTYVITKSKTQDVTVEIVKSDLNCTREHYIQCESSSLSDIAATAKEVITQETEVENSVVSVENLVPGNLEGTIAPPVNDAKLEILASKEVDITSFASGDNVTNSSANGMGSGNELGTADPEEKFTTFQGDVHIQTEVSGVRSKDSTCNDAVVSGTEGSDRSVVINENLLNSVPEIAGLENKGEQLSGADVNGNDEMLQKSEDEEKSHSNETSMSSMENPSGQDRGVEPLTRPFQFLIRIPKFDNLKFKDQVRQAELLVEEKTRLRDAFRHEIQRYKANCHAHDVKYEAAVSESRASKRSVKSKRAEIESLQSVINKVKNAISVEDIDARIYSMEHMIEHETLPLKEEKQFIREIKQLKQLREQLSSNIGSQDEVQQALNKRDQIEERLKILKKELDCLKDSVVKADAVARAIERKYEDENKKLKEVKAQFRAADNVRQEAYAHVQSLRKEVFEKNQQFRRYKEKAAAASDYAAKGEREALHHLCVNQVETIMELWNKNDEFRKEYVRCNARSILKRFGTLDGRSLGPDEEPPALATYGDEKAKELDRKDSKLQVQILEQENLVKTVEDVEADDKTKAKEAEPKSWTVKARKPEKPILRNGLPIADEITEKVDLPTEELEVAKKAEEVRKEEAAAKLKEQRRLEEKAKALEALERKKRNAEKVQMRAELRAQKEAEQRDKEREKRLRKKERKKTTATEVADSNNFGETTPSSENWTETIKESGIKESPLAVPKRPQKSLQFTKQSKTKSIPLPLRNKSRRKIQQWMWVILTCLLVIALFLLGNIGFFSNLSNLRQRSPGF